MKQVKLILVIIVIPLLASCILWRAAGDNMHSTNAGNVGIGTANPESKLTVVDDSTTPIPTDFSGISSTISSPTNARAIYGEAANTNGTNNYGGYFMAAGQSSGIYGHATDQNKGEAGGVFHSNGKRGKGVIGLAYNSTTNETNYGGWFDARGPKGVGIYSKGGSNGFAGIFRGNVRILDASGVILELGAGLDLAEGFNVSEAARIKPGSVLVIDPDNPGKLALCKVPYDKKVAGIVAGARNMNSGVRLGAGQFDYDVALAGRVYCNVDASENNIMPGDLLTTSSIPGHAMKAENHEHAQGAIIGKAMEKLSKGTRGQILVLVTLQ
jgi:hypothetical protein